METPAPFDLNNAIHRWRENLATSPAFRAENLDELEAHLRDSVGALVAKGLSEEEAWWVAQRRTGSANLLNQEYSVINAEHVWLERLIWMVAGFVLIGWLSTVTGVLTDLSTAAALALDASPQFHRILRVTAYPAALTAILAIIWNRIRRRSGETSDTKRWLRKHPIAAGVSVLFIGMMAYALKFGSMVLLLRFMSPTELGTHYRWYTTFGYLNLLLWPAVLTFLLCRRSRSKEAAA